MEEEFYTPRALRSYRDVLDASFHTPLQKLGERPISMEQIDPSYTRSTSLPVLEAMEQSKPATLDIRAVNWQQANSMLGDRLKFLSQAKPRAQESAASAGIFSSTKQSEPIYYKPPSHRDSQFGVKEFLPPNYASREQINKVPLFVNNVGVLSNGTTKEPSKNLLGNGKGGTILGDEELSDTEESAHPTGSYIAPTVKNALLQQIDSQRQVKQIGQTIILLLSAKLAARVINATLDYDVSYLLVFCYVLGAFIILSAVYKLLYRRRQGTALTLSNKQRLLLGLPPGNVNAENDAQDFTDTSEIIPTRGSSKVKSMPKYKKLLMQYTMTSGSPLSSGFISSLPKSEELSEVVNNVPSSLQMLKNHSRELNVPISKDIKTRFNKKFKLLFDARSIE